MNCVFDAYGTLFDVHAAARELAAEPGFEKLGKVWLEIATKWRTKQLSYTWLRTVSDTYADFWQVTCDALDWSLEAAGLAGDQALRHRLLDLYWALSAYPEVRQTLAELRRGGHGVAILSNGSPEMLDAAVNASGLESLAGACLSAESVGVFKPHPKVYRLATKHFNCRPGDILFVSSNGWDAAAATGFGFRSIWVNREGAPVERLPWKPMAVATDLTAIPTHAAD